MPARSPSLPIRQKYSWSPRETCRVDCKSTAGRCSGVSGRARGFTLVELLVVISIIAILSVVGVVVYSGVTKSAKVARAKLDTESIKKAYELNYDPTLSIQLPNNTTVSGGYKPLTGANFASGKIPAPDPATPISTTNTYIIQGAYEIPGQPSPSATANYALTFDTNTGSTCSASQAGCKVETSDQGVPVELFSLGNPVLNGSFESDGDSDGISDNWIKYGGQVTVSRAQSPTPKDGQYVQKIISQGGPYQGVSQIVKGLKPSTRYKQTGWMYLESGHGTCTSVGVGMQGSGGETFTGCDRMDQWVQLTLTGFTDALGNTGVGFQNWTAPAYFYVDSVRLEEVK